MNVNDIVALAHAGYTSEQITKFYNLATQQSNGTVQVQNYTQPPMSAQVQVSPMIQNPTSFSQQAADPNAQLVSQIVQGIQQSNLVRDRQPEPETTDQILAQVINPPGEHVMSGTELDAILKGGK